jgi:outer membrane receptor protein involved in Fe transport
VRHLNNLGVYKALLLAGGAGIVALASPAAAQVSNDTGQGADCNATPDDPRCIGESERPSPTPSTGTIVVTGSRIARQDFNSNSPMVTVDEALLENSSTAALEQNLNKLPQFTPAQTPTTGGADLQPNASNTAGAATVSLRGLGANRTLILVDGRRATPANASGVTDINTIPSAAIERVEVISGGASATYGADALAGVTNFILKKNFQGLELDGRMGITEVGDGFEYTISGIVGTDFADGRGNVMFAASMNDRGPQYQRARSWYREIWADPNKTAGSYIIQPGDPGILFATTNGFSDAVRNQLFPGTCFNNGATPGYPSGTCPLNLRVASGAAATQGGSATLYYNQQANTVYSVGFGSIGASQDKFTGYNVNGYEWKRTSVGTLIRNNTNLYLVLPLTRYNFLGRGNYEINDWIGMFGQGMFTHVATATRNEPGPITGGWGVDIPYGSGVYLGGLYPLTATAGNLPSVLRNGDPLNGNIGTPGATYTDPTPTVFTDNPTNPIFINRYSGILPCATPGNAAYRVVNGVPTGGCTNTQVFTQVIPDQIEAALNSRPNPNANVTLTGFLPNDREVFTDVFTYNMTGGFEGKIPGTDWTWEAFVNHGVSNTLVRQTGVYSLMRTRAVISSPNFGQNATFRGNPEQNYFGSSTAHCTSGVNIFNISATTEDCNNAIRADLKLRSQFRQTVAEANLQGGLFALPAGDLRAAVGASYREMDFKFLNDTLVTQGTSFEDQALGIYPSGDTFGQVRVRELYGELLVPILKDIPFIQELNLELGGRMSHYSTTGTSYTYKILGDWEITPWLRLRGGYNRAERAPNIAELFLAEQQIFTVSDASDPCSYGNPVPYSANQVGRGNNGLAAPTDTLGNPLGANVETMCRTLLNQLDPTGQAVVNFYGVPNATNTAYITTPNPAATSTANGGFAFVTTEGNPNLVPEKADTLTAGLVIQSPFTSGVLSRLRMSVDWWSIKVSDAIGQEAGSIIFRRCFDPLYNPLVATNPAQAAQNPACSQAILQRNLPNGDLGSFRNSYANLGRFKLQGIDLAVDWAYKVGPGMLTINANVNYMRDFKVAPSPLDNYVEYVGTTGTSANGLNSGAAYEWRSLVNVGYGIGPARVSLQWQHYPAIENAGEALRRAQGLGPDLITGTPAYDNFALSGSYQLTDDIGLRFGVENLLNEAPPIQGVNLGADATIGQLPGGSFGSAGIYDPQGRRYFLGANVRF